jgi:hypothetical protein
MGYNKQLVYPAFFNLYHFKQKSDPELLMIRNYRKHCNTRVFISDSRVNWYTGVYSVVSEKLNKKIFLA